ncbi:MAG: O-antigen polymerase [Terriglobia bacterium]
MKRNLTSGLTIVMASVAAAMVCALIAKQRSGVVLVSAAIIAVSLWIMEKTVGLFSFRKLTIPSFWYWAYLALVLVPGFFVYPGHPEPYRTKYLIGIESVLVTVPLGMWLANHLFRFNKSETARYFRAPLIRIKDHRPLLTGFLVLFLLALLLSVLYVLQVRSLPLWDLLTHPGDYGLLVSARDESLKLLDSRLVYAYAVLRSTIFPLLILIGLGRYIESRRYEWAVLFGSALILGLVYSALSIAKSPVSNIVLFLALFYYLFRGGRISSKAIGIVAVLFLAFPMYVIMAEYAGTVGFSGALQAVGDRLFNLPAQILYYYFRVFPDVMPHQHGATIGKVAWLLGEKTFDDANFVGRYMMARGFGFGSTVTANAPFIGSLYTDFGLPGVAVGGVLAGAIMQTLQIHILRRPKTTVSLALFAFLVITFAYLNVTTLPVVLLSDGALLALVFVAAIKHIDGPVLARNPGVRA